MTSRLETSPFFRERICAEYDCRPKSSFVRWWAVSCCRTLLYVCVPCVPHVTVERLRGPQDGTLRYFHEGCLRVAFILKRGRASSRTYSTALMKWQMPAVLLSDGEALGSASIPTHIEAKASSEYGARDVTVRSTMRHATI